MKLSSTGGIIAAANMNKAFPMLRIGSIPIIERIILTLQRADIFPIVVITSSLDRELQYALAHYGVVFLLHPSTENPELFSSFLLGLDFLKNECSRILCTPVNAPMFSADTVRRLIEVSEDKVAVPAFEGRCGHPLIIPSSKIGTIAKYSGKSGLKGAINTLCPDIVKVDVPDQGILLSTHHRDYMERFLEHRKNYLISPHVPLSLQREVTFFDPRLKLLLFLIDRTHTVSSAASLMRLSHSKAWDLLNTFELESGFSLVERKQGGNRGGNTTLSAKGVDFFLSYLEFEREIADSSKVAFEKHMSKFF